jgi:hypothetical protein
VKKWTEMSARERDALVAEKVMGWVDVRSGGKENTPAHWFIGRGSDGLYHHIPNYTTRMDNAWEVAEKLKIAIIPQAGEPPQNMKYLAEVGTEPFEPKIEVFAPTAPQAICLAALRAVGVEIE